jgi:hypothetical protein
MCVLCYLVAPITRLNNGIITYKQQMGFLQHRSILRLHIKKCGLNGLNEKKDISRVEKHLGK